ncbi:MAG: hypothetical protein PVG39_26430 [Desulfobacteraceae bacterium]|jgi:hypothetical protein
MKKSTVTFSLSLFLIALVIPVTSFADDEISCTRGGMNRAIAKYIDAQTKGDISNLPFGTMVSYKENMKAADIKTGILNTPMKIDHHASILDTSSCQTFTEIIVTYKEKPYVMGTRMRVNHDKIAEIETLWTTTGYWLFNADAYLKYATSENWGPIAAENRSSRGTLVAAANAYLDAFLEGKLDLVPWGFPCERVEGGAYTGTGSPDDSCEVGVPSEVNITNRRFIVDEVTGSVQVFCSFGPSTPDGGTGAADSHLFRIENGKLR